MVVYGGLWWFMVLRFRTNKWKKAIVTNITLTKAEIGIIYYYYYVYV